LSYLDNYFFAMPDNNPISANILYLSGAAFRIPSRKIP